MTVRGRTGRTPKGRTPRRAAPRRRLPAPRPAATRASIGPVLRAAGVQLRGFVMQVQGASQWCWAAVSSSVAAFYARGGPFPSQCQIAAGQLDRACCADPGACDRPWYLEYALGRHGAGRLGGKATLQRLHAEIVAGRPVCLQVQVEPRVLHYVVVDAVDPNGWIRLADPRTGGRASWRVEQLAATWTDTYWTA